MALIQTNIHGNPNVGLYGYITDTYGIVGLEVPEDLVQRMQKIFHVPLYHMNICGTSLVGVFLTGNSTTLLVPPIILEHEQKLLDRHKIKYTIIPTTLTALGNNILCNNNVALVNPEFSANIKKTLRQALNVPLKPGTIAGVGTVGSQAALNCAGCFINQEMTDEEEAYLAELIKIPLCRGTINMGGPQIRSGLLANDHGMVISTHSSGIEAMEAESCMGLTQK